MMIEFLEFGRYFVVADNLFIAEVLEGGEKVELTSILGSPKAIAGDDARQFIAMAKARVRVRPCMLPTPDAADEPRAGAPPEPPEDGPREAPAEPPSIVTGTPLHAPRPTAEDLRSPAKGQG